MDSEKIFALLDADFIIKTMIAQKNEKDRLIDWLFLNSRDQFVCHEMAMQEISKHDKCGAVPWLSNAVSEGRVILYTDLKLVTELHNYIGSAGIQMYKDFLKISCDSMSATFYTQHYSMVDAFDPAEGITAFLNVLHQCDVTVGSSNSLGEKKAMILLQWLQFFYPNKVYLLSIPCKQIFDEIYDDKFDSLMTGFLRYKHRKKQNSNRDTAL